MINYKVLSFVCQSSDNARKKSCSFEHDFNTFDYYYEYPFNPFDSASIFRS